MKKRACIVIESIGVYAMDSFGFESEERGQTLISD